MTLTFSSFRRLAAFKGLGMKESSVGWAQRAGTSLLQGPPATRLGRISRLHPVEEFHKALGF